MIGTLNEGPLHAALKDCYLRELAAGGAVVESEVAVDGFVADIRSGETEIYEIQTAGFGAMRRKLDALLVSHRVVLVHPIALQRYIVKLPKDTDATATRRRSPKRGRLAHLVAELVRIPELLNHPNFSVEAVLVIEDEIREHAPEQVRRRGGWRVVQRRLVSIEDRHRFDSAADLFRLIDGELPQPFTTSDLAAGMAAPRWAGQKLAYCLRALRAIEICGKRGNALLYRQTQKV